jgi:hypothetical protein
MHDIHPPNTLLMDADSDYMAGQTHSHTPSPTSLCYPYTTPSEPGDSISSESEYFDDEDMCPANYNDESAIDIPDSFQESEVPVEMCLVCNPFNMLTLHLWITHMSNRKLNIRFRNWCDHIPDINLGPANSTLTMTQ